MSDSYSNLVRALRCQFSEEEAGHLATMLMAFVEGESIAYQNISLDDEIKDDMLLLAYEKRLLLPMKSRRGSAWEDRVLGFEPGQCYHLPRVIWLLIKESMESGQWNAEHAIEKALEEAGEKDIKTMVKYLNEIKMFSPRYKVEVRMMEELAYDLGLDIDLHDVLDRFVRCGIMSLRARDSLHSGISSYEINPCLY